ncbi:MAG TPA: cytochrome c3 family protein [Methylomirabilota bacterium]|nr:cytochrome c3 family protein [Methylomirabilota bacterium]
MRLVRAHAKWVLGSALGTLAFIGLVLSACTTLDRTTLILPEIEGAHFVGDASCVNCHTNTVRQFAMNPHAHLDHPDPKFADMGGCESCHGPGSKHVQVGGGRGRFIHSGKDEQLCFNCHQDTHSEFRLPHHHPVIEDKMSCSQCHDPHGPDIMKPAGGMAFARLNQQCATCHREQSRQFVFEHEALRDGCIVCHQPHGAVNRALLTERDSNLCLKCHAQEQGIGNPGDFYIGKENHRNHLRRGGCWTAGCHTAVHGSNVSPDLRY